MIECKVINDPIHGHVTIPGFCLEFIDTPQFQRLRDLMQLGTTYYVFPGATHNRFEHSIGVSVLANRMISQMKARQPELEISDRDIKCVTLAGLCHDLGHGPYSHCFEKWMRYFVKDYSHETMSMRVLDYLIDDNGIDIDSEDVKFIKSLINGFPMQKNTADIEDRNWIYNIVSNKKNSIDVDKWDYLTRDSYSLGIKCSYDYSRLMHYNRVIDDEICFHIKEAYDIYEMFHTRYSLFKLVYCHRVTRCMDYMIRDVFLLADPHIKISERAMSPDTFCTLSDYLLKEIEISTSKELSEARNLIHRIRKRDLYSTVSTVLLEKGLFEDMDEKSIASALNRPDLLTEDDVIIDKFQCDYAFNDRNPVDLVHFFGKWNDTKSFSLKREHVSFLIPSTYSESYIRLFCKYKGKKDYALQSWQILTGSRPEAADIMYIPDLPPNATPI